MNDDAPFIPWKAMRIHESNYVGRKNPALEFTELLLGADGRMITFETMDAANTRALELNACKAKNGHTW